EGLGFHFLFSSRRRHTRSKRDWSSDVCSSDLKDSVRIIFYYKNAIWDHAYSSFSVCCSRAEASISLTIKLSAIFLSSVNVLILRSEERRVGTEGRGRRTENQTSKQSHNTMSPQ